MCHTTGHTLDARHTHLLTTVHTGAPTKPQKLQHVHIILYWTEKPAELTSPCMRSAAKCRERFIMSTEERLGIDLVIKYNTRAV